MKSQNRKFKILLPFVHYRLELPELLQGVLMIAVGLSTVPVLQETLGLSYEAALTAVAIAEALGLLHVLFADPVVPGWIASALSLVLTYLGGYTVGIESIHALMALQLLISLIFILLGVTGLAHKLVAIVPASLKSGILLGAAISALARVIGEGGYLSKYPLSVGSGAVVAIFVLYSVLSKKLKDRSRVYREIAKYGMLSSLLVSMAVGFISGELPLPTLKWGFIPFAFGELFETASVFSIGLPSLKSFISAAPVAVAVYVVAFGEIITAESVLQDCQHARPDDHLNFNSNRTNIIAGVRNLLLALFCPFTALAGPLWAAVTVSIGERYKEGKKSMKTLFGGLGSFKLSTALCVIFMPIASLLEPILPVALATTLVVQAFACSYIAIEQVKDDRNAAGTAGITGATVFIASLNWALVVGLLSYIIIEGGDFGLRRKAVSINENRRENLRINRLAITLEQDCGAHGEALAELLGRKLGLPVYDHQLLETASAQSGISLELMEGYARRDWDTSLSMKVAVEQGIDVPAPSRFAAAIMEAGRSMYDTRRPCILLDHHSYAAMENVEDCLNIFVTAPRAARLENMAAAVPGLTKAQMKAIDKRHKYYYRSVNRRWGNSDRYNITLDTSKADLESLAQQVTDYLAQVTGQELVVK